ncbi:MAG: hypothetical protein KAS32_14110 [Candidatus Peribacteraceae bacterium]|nr:hypothetical protein [Candidatus Peribacteraceae bacterium]
MSQKTYLHVCLPSRDRPILTQKCIESIHSSTSKFDEVCIYVFDNLTDNLDNRFQIFSKLLKNKTISYYSYDTSESSNKCFPKAPIFRRFIHMMMEKTHLDKEIGKNNKHYFMLSDNDMIYGPGWDAYFMTAADLLDNRNPTIHFLVRHIGGIPLSARNRAEYIKVPNRFSNDEIFEVCLANGGGGSGFWFMSEKMLPKLYWSIKDLKNTHDQFKRHDTTSWQSIKSKLGPSDPYVAGVVPINEEDPMVLHMGGIVGSMCNILNNKVTRNTYLVKRNELFPKESELESLSALEIYNKFKTTRQVTVW